MANNEPSHKIGMGQSSPRPVVAPTNATKPMGPDCRLTGPQDDALENLYHKSMDRGLSFLSFISRHSSTSPADCSKTSSGIFCRICHDGENSERLISPCMCSGSMALVHRTCIEKWLSTANNDNCELCHHKYVISKHPRPFMNWLCEPGVEDDQRNLVGDIVCFFLLTPLAAISTYLCATGAAFYLEEKKSEAIGLICLCVVLVLIYLVWVTLTIKYHVQVWFVWRENNQEIRLIEVGKEPVSRTHWRNPYGAIDYQTVVDEPSTSTATDDKSSVHPSIASLRESRASLRSGAASGSGSSIVSQHSNVSLHSFGGGGGGNGNSKPGFQPQQMTMQIVFNECSASVPVVVSNHGVYVDPQNLPRSSIADLNSTAFEAAGSPRKMVPPPPPPPSPPTPLASALPVRANMKKYNFHIDGDLGKLESFDKELESAIAARSTRQTLASVGSCCSSTYTQDSTQQSLSEAKQERNKSSTDTLSSIVCPVAPERRSSLNRAPVAASPLKFSYTRHQNLREEKARLKPLSPLVKQAPSTLDHNPGIERNDAIVYAQPVYCPENERRASTKQSVSEVGDRLEVCDDEKDSAQLSVADRCASFESLPLSRKASSSSTSNLVDAEELPMPSVGVRRTQLQLLLNTQALLPREQ